MERIFKYEKDLVNTFISNYFHKNDKIPLRELPIRWGNIDVAFILGNKKVPFNSKQIELLSKPSNAKIFMKIKKNRPISEKALFNDLGLSKNTFDNCIRSLVSSKLIQQDENSNYIRCIDYTFPKVKIYGYEAKLSDYNKAFYQACINKNYVDYSYMVFPMDIAMKIKSTYNNILLENNIGLVGVDKKHSKVLIKANKKNNIKSYIKLLTIMQYVEN